MMHGTINIKKSNILNLSFSLGILVYCMAIEHYYHPKNNLVTFFFLVFIIWQNILINLVILRPLSKFKKLEIYSSVNCMSVACVFNFH